MPLEGAIESILLSFLVGSIPFGWVIARLFGVKDLRRVGSTNIGATNVVRAAGWVAGALTFVLDFSKGVIPVLVFPSLSYACGVAAVLGHCYSPLLRFRGGKGVSTILGMGVALQPIIGVTAILIYLLGLAVTRTSALGSLFAVCFFGFAGSIFSDSLWNQLLIGGVVFVVLNRHRQNWAQLIGRLTMVAWLSILCGSASSDAAISVQDFRGKNFQFNGVPQRVVTLMPALGEMVIDLGFAGKLVGVAHETANLPEGDRNIRDLGYYPRISVESVVALHPDVVLASKDGNDAALVKKLEAVGITTIVIDTSSIKDLSKTVEILGLLLQCNEHPLIKRFQSDFGFGSHTPEKAVGNGVGKGKKLLLQIGWSPLIAVGGKTFIDDVVERSGNVNIFQDSLLKYPRPQVEEVLNRNPDVILILKMGQSDGAEQEVLYWRKFSGLKAVQTNSIYVLKPGLLTKPGFSLIEGLRFLKGTI